MFYHFCWDKNLDWFVFWLIFSTFATRLIGKEVLDWGEEWWGRKKSSNNFCRYGKHSYLCSPNKKGVKFTDVSKTRKKIETMVNREKVFGLDFV